MEKKDIKSLDLNELKIEMEALSEKAFRAKQMYEWMHVKLARGFQEMTNLSEALRKKCEEMYEFTSLEVVQVQESKIDGTKKFLFGLKDGNVVESVWMKSIRQMGGQVSRGSLPSIRQMSGQRLHGSVGAYQADERAGVARLSW